ncbi:hypothetical protein SeMB42_g02293 [Synchytrium endobioticum]|nr:hypothetical protein SeMB42_g02293 [Synchytrium endobioticum]
MTLAVVDMHEPYNVDMSQVELAIQHLYTGSPDQVRSSQSWLHKLQRQNQAWALAFQMLTSNAPNTRFVGAQTLLSKIAQDWESLAQEDAKALRNELLSQTIRASQGPRFVLRKLCVALSAYAIRSCTLHWPECIQSACLHFSTLVQKSSDPNTQVALQNVLIEWLTVLPEEASSASLPPKTRAKVDDELLRGVPVALNVLEQALDLPGNNDNESLQLMKTQSFKAIKSWVQYGIPIELMGRIYYKMIQQMNTSMWMSAMDVIADVIVNPRMAGYGDTIANGLLNALTTGPIYAEFKRAFTARDDESSSKICQLVVDFAEQYAVFLVVHLARQDVGIFMDMLLAYTHYPGIFALDQEISDLPLTVWANIQEALHDGDVLPMPSATTYDLKTDPHSTRPMTPPTQKQLPSEATRATLRLGQTIFAKLLSHLIDKMVFPADTSGWSAEEKEKFRVYRRDVNDCILVCYYVLRRPALETMVDRAVALARSSSFESAVQELEAVLTAISAVSEAVTVEDEAPLSNLFSDSVFGKLATSVSPASRLRLTLFLLVGNYAEYHSRHPEGLSAIMSYLINGLSSDVEAPYAAKAFRSICSECSHGLLSGADWLVNLWLQSGSKILPSERPKVVEAIADVVQAMPLSSGIPRILALMYNIAQSLQELLSLPPEKSPMYRDAIISLVSQLKSCCRGIHNDMVDLTGDAITSLSLRLATTAEERAVCELVWNCLKIIVSRWCEDTEVVAVVMTFLYTSFTGALPLISPSMAELVSLLTELYSRSPNPAILTASNVLACVVAEPRNAGLYGTDIHNLVSQLCIVSVHVLQAPDDGSPSRMEYHPDLSEAFFGLVTDLISKAPVFVVSLQVQLQLAVFQHLLIAALRAEERFTLKAAHGLLLELIAAGTRTSNNIAQFSNEFFQLSGEVIMKELLTNIESRQPRTQLKQSAEVLFKMVSVYPDISRNWMINWANVPVASARISVHDKHQLTRSLLGTRNLKKFKESILEFATKSRGLETTLGAHV